MLVERDDVKSISYDFLTHLVETFSKRFYDAVMRAVAFMQVKRESFRNQLLNLLHDVLFLVWANELDRRAGEASVTNENSHDVRVNIVVLFGILYSFTHGNLPTKDRFATAVFS